MTSQRPLPEGWRWAALGEVCEINPRRPRDLPATPDELVTFIPMSAVDEGAGAVTQPQERPLAEVTRGYTYMEDGDVIFAKITPCMQNGKHAIVGDTLTGFAFGSTEFHVLRPGDAIHPVWVHRFLLQPSVLYEAKQHFTGTAGQRRVPKQYLIEKHIPLPSLAEQRRIVADLEAQMEAAERARRAAEAQLAAMLAMPAALLREIFPDPQRRAQGARLWGSGELGKMCVVDRKAITAEHPRYAELAYLGLEHIEAGTGRILISEDAARYSESISNNFLFTNQHVLYGKLRPYLNKVALPEFEGRCTTEIIPLLPTEADREWLAWFLRREETVEHAMRGRTGSRMPRADMPDLMRLSAYLPPIDEQRRIVADLERSMAAAERARRAAEAQLAAAEALPSAILRSAFAREAA